MQTIEYEPSIEEIARQCALIRQEWSEEEHWRRAGHVFGRPHWFPPGVEPFTTKPSDVFADKGRVTRRARQKPPDRVLT